jgi:hypothetical protein
MLIFHCFSTFRIFENSNNSFIHNKGSSIKEDIKQGCLGMFTNRKTLHLLQPLFDHIDGRERTFGFQFVANSNDSRALDNSIGG